MSVVENVPDEVLERIQKLFQLAAKNPSESEAASATAKAQELLERYNLDADAVNGAAVGSGAREKVALDGGFYLFEQQLWRGVAELNFCLYWHERSLRRGGRTKKRVFYDEAKVARNWGYDHHHRLVGRKVNVAATKAMAGYLRQVVERLTLDRIRGADDLPQYGRWANSYRNGIVARICQKLRERRNEVLAAEHQHRADEERAADNASTSRALSLQVYLDKETDANLDFLYGEGYSAKRAAAAAERRGQQEAYTRWAAEHPEEAAAEEAKRRKEARRPRGRTKTMNVDRSAYWDGWDSAADVSIDQQTEHRKPTGLL